MSLIFISDTFAQSSFCDDFESYSSGSYLGSLSNSWTTWTQPYTATEDVQVTNALSNSGSNSIYFNGFDATVQAGGYNSFHETRTFGLPALFYPNMNTGMDDQLARCNV